MEADAAVATTSGGGESSTGPRYYKIPHITITITITTTITRFEIKKWNAVAMWSWDICADTCAICRNSLNEPSIEYQVSASSSFSFYINAS